MSNFDEALERFHQVDFEYAGGLANHGPMVAEALENIGHQALIPAFVGLYVPRLPLAEPGRPLLGGDEENAYGQIERAADWAATFEARLRGGDWRTVLQTEVPALLPGLYAAAGHGMLRTVHAIRALEREDSALRRKELARGLAYWAARFQALPGLPGSRLAAEAIPLAQAFAAWPLLDDPEARLGLFTRVVLRLDDFSPFTRAFEAVPLPTPDSVGRFLDTLCVHAAELYVGNPAARVACVHALTIPSGARTLIQYLEPRDACVAASYSLQAVGALQSIFGRAEASPEHDDEVVRVAEDWDEIRYHAACSIQEHSIKMVDACWREDRHRENPAFRRAAADAALKIEGRGQPATC